MGGLWGILSGLTKSTDHPSKDRLSREARRVRCEDPQPEVVFMQEKRIA